MTDRTFERGDLVVIVMPGNTAGPTITYAPAKHCPRGRIIAVNEAHQTFTLRMCRGGSTHEVSVFDVRLVVPC